jgi:uncharacterized delta-60 repeat protein
VRINLMAYYGMPKSNLRNSASLIRLLPLGLLVSSLAVSSAFGQCSPVAEGSLPLPAKIASVRPDSPPPPTKIANVRPDSPPPPTKIASVVPETKKVDNPAARVPASVLSPRSPRVNAGAAVRDPGARPAIAMRPNAILAKPVRFAGPVSIPVPGAGGASKIVEQDGRFIIAGGSDVSSGQVNEQAVFLARYEADGTPDPSFGQGGSTRIVLFAQNNMGNVSPPSVALSPNGKIVIARTISDMFPGNQPGSRIAVARLDHDGSLDPAFGNGGLVYTTIKNHFQAHSVAVQRDDKVIVAGESSHVGDCHDETCVRFGTLVRYQSNGEPDPTFGSSGVVRSALFVGGPAVLSNTYFSNLFVQENGLIVAAGEIETGSGDLIGTTKMLIAEYQTTGELNPAFGTSGAVMLTFDGPYQRFSASSLAVRENGRILAGGSASLYAGISGEGILVDQAFVFAQVTPGGELDGTFGNGGKVVVDVNPRVGASPPRPLDELSRVMLGPSGDIYAAGMASGPVGNSESAIDIVALNSDGSLKQNFGNAGLFSTGTYTPWRIWLAQDALLTSDGRLVISGTHWTNHLPDAFVLWAYSVTPGPAACPP